MKYINQPNFEHGQKDKIGILLTNLGTPEAPTAKALKPYLKEFLSDPRVVEVPRLIWWMVLNGVILPIRSGRSAKSYETVWTEQGSPLLINTENIAKGVAESLKDNEEIIVDYAMRYGSPSVDSKIQSLIDRGANKLLVFPLYPQYSATTTASTFDAVANSFKRRRLLPELRFINHYTNSNLWQQAIVNKIKAHWQQHGRPDKLIFSYHGIPQRYWDNGDPYACQCHKTTRLLATQLGLKPDEYMTCFQSRFGREEWVKPYLDHTLKSLPKDGTKHVQVICPGFSADCLETLEEIAEENRDYFIEAGGDKFEFIPCLNDESEHIDALVSVIDEHIHGWRITEDFQLRAERASALKATKND